MTPLQQAALAVIDKWVHSHPLKELAILELRKALDAELQQSVEPVCFASINKQGDVCSTLKQRDSWRTIPLYLHPPQQSVEPAAWMTQDGVACIPLYLHPPQQANKQYSNADRRLLIDKLVLTALAYSSDENLRDTAEDCALAADILEADAQQAKQVPMTDDAIEDIWLIAREANDFPEVFARAIEAHHGIGGQP